MMLSIQSPPSYVHARACAGSAGTRSIQKQFEPVCVEDGVRAFKDLILRTGGAFLRLHCTVPTWSSAPVNCVDLHDLYDLQSRSLLFLHELQKSLRAIGVQATYRLVPTDTDVVVIQAFPAEGSVKWLTTSRHVDAGREARVNGSGKMLMGSTEKGPVVVMT